LKERIDLEGDGALRAVRGAGGALQLGKGIQRLLAVARAPQAGGLHRKAP